MECDQCNGTGEIKQSPYREAANQVKEKLKPAGNIFSRAYGKTRAKIKAGKRWVIMGTLKKMASATLSFIMVLFWPVAIIGGIIFIVVAIVRADKERSHIRNVYVQYDDKGTPIRCFTNGYGYSSPISDHYSNIQTTDNNIKSALKSMNADNMKCADLK